MYRRLVRSLVVVLVASFLFAAEMLPVVGQQAPPATLGAPVAQVTPAGQGAQAQTQLGQPRQAVAPVNPLGPPFQLTPVEKQFVNQILMMWENESAKINTFDCQFERWEYNAVWGPNKNIPLVKSEGRLTYSKPDKGSFKIEEMRHWKKIDPNQPGPEPCEWVTKKDEVGEHWVCDGKSVYQYDHSKKQLVVVPIPPNMRGAAIVDGPLPFLFGAKAKKLNERYWIRSKQGEANTIWLEAYPRRQADAANYHHVDIMLERKTMQPTALRVHEPNGQSTAVYMFKKPTVNGTMNKLFGSLFNAPRTPFGWKRVVQQVPAGAQAGPQAAQPQGTQQR